MKNIWHEKARWLLIVKIAIIAGLCVIAWGVYVKDFNEDPLTKEQMEAVECWETWQKAV